MSAEGFRARARPEPPSAQILVVVANTLERSWRTDAEKGFLSTAVAQVLVDPKPRAKALQRGPPTPSIPSGSSRPAFPAPYPSGSPFLLGAGTPERTTFYLKNKTGTNDDRGSNKTLEAEPGV